ncbi:MAG TPA: SusE domain-containing protein [Balneolales bacterium]|nr:SusE domain-containing protein [Balneolales bacterium]
MKNIGIAFTFLLSILILSSCDTKHNGPYLSATPGSPSISAPDNGANYVLQEANAKDTLFTMVWSEPNYGYPAAINYSIEMSKQGDNFANPINVGTSHQAKYSVIVGDMNGVLLGQGFNAGEAATVDMRITASVSDSINEEISDPITVNFTPYSVCKYCSAIYVPGDYQAASGYTNDWSPGDAPALASVDNKDLYTGYVYMTNANGQVNFKFTNERSWTLNWGAGSSAGTLAENADNIVAPDTGYFKIDVDLNAMTYTMLKTSWGVIGSATPGGWDNDTNMSYDPAQKVWSITLNLSAGDIKFRANDSWDLNYGDTGADGKLDAGGDNISVSAAGNYTVVLNLSDPNNYTYSLTKN